MLVHRKANILVLTGVFLSDYDTVTTAAVEPETTYNEIPRKFISVETWPRSTNLLCWSCSLVPSGAPMFIPQCPEITSTGTEICDAMGNFCNGGCAANYIDKFMPSVFHWDLLELLIRFESKFTGVRRAIIPRPQSHTEMKQYCGPHGLTPKQWRDKAEAHSRDLMFRIGS